MARFDRNHWHGPSEISKHDLSYPIEGISEEELDSVLLHFSEQGYIDYGRAEFGIDTIVFKVNVEAHDLINHGGFEAKELLFQETIGKLFKEVEKLEKESEKNFTPYLENLEKLTNIVSGAFGLGIIVKDKL